MWEIGSEVFTTVERSEWLFVVVGDKRADKLHLRPHREHKLPCLMAKSRETENLEKQVSALISLIAVLSSSNHRQSCL